MIKVTDEMVLAALAGYSFSSKCLLKKEVTYPPTACVDMRRAIEAALAVAEIEKPCGGYHGGPMGEGAPPNGASSVMKPVTQRWEHISTEGFSNEIEKLGYELVTVFGMKTPIYYWKRPYQGGNDDHQ